MFPPCLNLKYTSGSLLAVSVLSRIRPGKNDCIIYLRIYRSNANQKIPLSASIINKHKFVENKKYMITWQKTIKPRSAPQSKNLSAMT